MATISTSWTKATTHSQLQRSSHNVSIIDNTVYIFGGELLPREPRDNDVHKVTLGDKAGVTVSSLPASSPSPSPRVGSASTALHNKIYLFSGRGGTAMSPIEEHGALWTLDSTANTWSLLSPSSQSPSSPEGNSFPSARSYHALTSDSHDTLFLHAGCPSSGRLSDFWSFSLSSKTWTQLADAPGAPRGGTSIAFSAGKVYRLGGFDGEKEIGGRIDVYDVAEDQWSTREFEADGKSGPGARSVAALVAVEIGGKGCLVSLFGESDPSSLGHMGAGKMLGDGWVYGVEEGVWRAMKAEEGEETPRGRGWFDADVVKVDGKDAVVVVGGLGEENERLDDLWILKF